MRGLRRIIKSGGSLLMVLSDSGFSLMCFNVLLIKLVSGDLTLTANVCNLIPTPTPRFTTQQKFLMKNLSPWQIEIFVHINPSIHNFHHHRLTPHRRAIKRPAIVIWEP